MKPPPYIPEKFVKLTLFARPLRANTLAHWSALVAHAPASSNAFARCGNSRVEPSEIAVARIRLRSALIGFPLSSGRWSPGVWIDKGSAGLPRPRMSQVQPADEAGRS